MEVDEIKPDPDVQVGNNPWLVSTLDSFLYYNCPECDLKTKEYDNFYEHAIHHHPNSKVAEWFEEPLDVKAEDTEVLEDEFDEDMEDFKPVIKAKSPNKKSSQCYYCGELFSSSEQARDHVSHNHNANVTLTMYGKVRDYQCDVCKFMFLKEDHKILHICGTVPPIWTGASSTSKQKCPKCDQEFSNYNAVLNHHARIHSEVKLFKCDQCDFESSTRVSLYVHQKNHTGGSVCDICNRTFKSIVTLQKHKKQYHGDTKFTAGLVKCDMCDFKGTLGQVKKHKLSSHPDSQKFYCDQCDYVCILDKQLKDHIRKRHNLTHVCHMCGKGFYYAKLLKDHIEKMHHESKIEDFKEFMNYTCDKCGKSYANENDLSKHNYHVHSQKFFMCTLCDRTFSVKRKLQDHLVLEHQAQHVKDDLCACDKCDSRFVTSLELNAHYQVDHDMTSEYPCTQCSKLFVSQLLQNLHMIESHDFNPIKMINPDQGNYKCDICGIYLKTEKTLLCHKIGQHQKESHSYKCDLCSFTTFQSSKLKQHIDRQHNKVRPKKVIQCPHCPRSFYERRPFNRHLLDEHDILPKK